MSEHDDPTEDHELYEEVPPRSIFAATWFRVVLVVIVIGVIGAVAIPYVLDWMNPPPSKPAVASKAPAAPGSSVATPSTPAPSSAPDKKDSTLIPAPGTPSVPPPSAPAEGKPLSPTARPVEPKPTPPTARPVEPKSAAPKPEPKATASVPETKSKSAMAVTDSTPSKPAAKPEPATPAPAAKPDTVAKADTAKPAPATPPTKDDAKPTVAAKATPAPKRAATTPKPATAASGPYWVQVGAFKDADTAKRLAAKLREENFTVEESVKRTGGAPAAAPSAPKPAATARPDIGSDQYDVIVTGQTPEELNKRLAAKGLAAEPSGNGMVVKPSLPLRDAVALSKDLAVEGFKVQVRRTGGPMASASPATPPSAPAAGESGSELHRVRVGGFADRAAAVAALKQLEAKGYKPYIGRGDQ